MGEVLIKQLPIENMFTFGNVVTQALNNRSQGVYVCVWQTAVQNDVTCIKGTKLKAEIILRGNKTEQFY